MSLADTRRHAIVCPIALFGPVEREVRAITDAMNRASDLGEKAVLAGRLRDAVATLLDCAAYDEATPDCRLCRQVSSLRDRTATLVQRAAGLAEGR